MAFGSALALSSPRIIPSHSNINVSGDQETNRGVTRLQKHFKHRKHHFQVQFDHIQTWRNFIFSPKIIGQPLWKNSKMATIEIWKSHTWRRWPWQDSKRSPTIISRSNLTIYRLKKNSHHRRITQHRRITRLEKIQDGHNQYLKFLHVG